MKHMLSGLIVKNKKRIKIVHLTKTKDKSVIAILRDGREVEQRKIRYRDKSHLDSLEQLEKEFDWLRKIIAVLMKKTRKGLLVFEREKLLQKVAGTQHFGCHVFAQEHTNTIRKKL